MKTPWGERLNPAHVLEEYPRPQLRRSDCTVLNGEWDYAITASDRWPKNWDGKILVPFSPEAPLSGVNRTLQPGEYLWYRRDLPLRAEPGKRVLLHFGAVDQMAQIWVNGKPLGSHAGGYTAFTMELTELLAEENELLVRVRDDTEENHMARGKQKTKRGGIWYTPQSGIWQTVWAETVPERYIEDLRIVPKFDEAAVEITIHAAPGECAVEFGGQTYPGQAGAPIRVPVPNFKPWTPETPVLYDFTALCGEDRAESYFAMRKVEIRADEKGVPRIHLNGLPYFMNGVLDQGYWPDGLYTAPSDEALIFDIQAMKDMGFNMLRKHIKTEPMRWYYHCDRLGMLVWQDMINGGGEYGFWTISTPLITGWHRKDDRYKAFARENAEAKEQFWRELEELILQLRNVPSIVLWTPFNEGWGQFDAEKAVELIQKLDPDRLIDHASGWHDQGIGQLKSYHVYFTKYRYRPDKKGRAVILSENGGYNLMVQGHSWNDRNFGYKKVKDAEALQEAYEALIIGQVLPAMEQGLSAAVYTQLSDVEDEVNGLYTYDRKLPKASVAAIRNCNLQLISCNQRR